MSHKASPWENGGCESWAKTLKYEEVFRQEYRDRLRLEPGVSPVGTSANRKPTPDPLYMSRVPTALGNGVGTFRFRSLRW